MSSASERREIVLYQRMKHGHHPVALGGVQWYHPPRRARVPARPSWDVYLELTPDNPCFLPFLGVVFIVWPLFLLGRALDLW